MPTVADDPLVRPAAGRPIPDPASVRGVGDFVSLLRLLKVWAGDPSYAELQRRCGVPASTLADATNPGRARLPRLETVRALVRACGASPDLARWELAWRVVQARCRGGNDPHRSALAAAPRQLPRPARHFEGRQDVLDQLDRLHCAHTNGQQWAPVVAIVGPPGIGKTALALHWAHRVADAYPDGQLWVDVPEAARPAGPEVLALLLAALGLPAAEIPTGFAARVGLYRSLTRTRRVLVVLDGTPCAAQARALLPAGPSCLTVVTSRDRLSGLVAGNDAQRIRLGPLSPSASQRLIELLVGPERAAREPAATVSLAQLCGHLPLALRIAAAQLADAPHQRLGAYLNWLAEDPIAALAVTGDESLSVSAALDRSVRRLADPARRLFHLLAGTREPQFSHDHVAAWCGVPPAEARRLLDTLAAAHLVEPVGSERYAMPELVRRYAQARASRRQPAQLVQVAGATWTANGSSAR